MPRRKISYPHRNQPSDPDIILEGIWGDEDQNQILQPPGTEEAITTLTYAEIPGLFEKYSIDKDDPDRFRWLTEALVRDLIVKPRIGIRTPPKAGGRPRIFDDAFSARMKTLRDEGETYEDALETTARERGSKARQQRSLKDSFARIAVRWVLLTMRADEYLQQQETPKQPSKPR